MIMGRKVKHKEIPKRLDLQPALLECTGSPSCGMWVPHVFKECVRRSDVKVEIWDHVYACKQCGATRKWGNSGLPMEKERKSSIDRDSLEN